MPMSLASRGTPAQASPSRCPGHQFGSGGRRSGMRRNTSSCSRDPESRRARDIRFPGRSQVAHAWTAMSNGPRLPHSGQAQLRRRARLIWRKPGNFWRNSSGGNSSVKGGNSRVLVRAPTSKNENMDLFSRALPRCVANRRYLVAVLMRMSRHRQPYTSPDRL